MIPKVSLVYGVWFIDVYCDSLPRTSISRTGETQFPSFVLLLLGIALLLAGCSGSSRDASRGDGERSGSDSVHRTGRPDSGTFDLLIDTTEADEERVPYDPTPMDVVDAMLERADVGPGDVVVDLGSGDGRIPIRAADRFGARAVGYEIDSALVARSRAAARDSGVADRVTFYHRDLFEADLSEATVVTLYLFRPVNIKLRPKLLEELDPGDRVVSHRFHMGDWEPDGKFVEGWHWFYMWTIPEEPPAL